MAATLSRPVAKTADESLPIYIELPQVQTRRGYLVFKRCFDFTFALLALIVLAVPMGIIAAIIALDSPGGPIYRQERLGKDGKPFLICKFRSMRTDAEKDGPKWAERSDDRCTRFGALLRKTRLDELPQLWNILKGEMSFVGTRPEVRKYVVRYTDEMMATLLMPAGVTSLASISFKDEDELIDEYTEKGMSVDDAYMEKVLPEKMKYNLEYMNQFGAFRDIKLMIQTFVSVIK